MLHLKEVVHLQSFVLFDESLGACGQDLRYRLTPFSLLVVRYFLVVFTIIYFVFKIKNLYVFFFQYIKQIPRFDIL